MNRPLGLTVTGFGAIAMVFYTVYWYGQGSVVGTLVSVILGGLNGAMFIAWLSKPNSN